MKRLLVALLIVLSSLVVPATVSAAPHPPVVHVSASDSPEVP